MFSFFSHSIRTLLEVSMAFVIHHLYTICSQKPHLKLMVEEIYLTENIFTDIKKKYTHTYNRKTNTSLKIRSKIYAQNLRKIQK